MVDKLLEETLRKIVRNQEEILKLLNAIESRIEILEEETGQPSIIEELPNHLKITYDAIEEEGEITASEISEKTGRSRNLESMYCCQLERMGILERRSEGRKQYFGVKIISNGNQER